MEWYFLSAIFVFALFVSLSLGRLLTRKSVPNLPPGKMGLPVIGESLSFVSAARKGHPEKFVNDRMAKYNSKIFKTSIVGSPTVVFCGAAANKFLFANENKLVVATLPEPAKKIFPHTQESSMLEEYKAIRRLLPSFLKPEALKRYIGDMDTIAQCHFAECWEGKAKVTVYPLAKDYSLRLGCKLFLSIEDLEQIGRYGDKFNDLMSGIYSIPLNLPGMAFYRGIKASEFIREELMRNIKQRKIDLAENKASPTQDILSVMLLTSDENGKYMTELDIADKIMGLVMAGQDTASASISSVVKYLAELPHIYDQVLKEQLEIASSKPAGELLSWDDIQKMRYTWNVLCETLRLIPPSPGAFKEALEDFSYKGFTIPKGWKVHWSVHSTHKNPQYFPEPEKFDPTRFQGSGPAPFTFVPFGGGPSICPGKEFSRIAILVFIHNLVKRFRLEKLIPDEKLVADLIYRPGKGCPVRLLPRCD